MAATATDRLTVEEVERRPPDGSWELIDGELVQLSPAGGESSEIGLTVGSLLRTHVRARKLGRVFGADAGFVLFPDRQIVRSPDAAFVSAARVPPKDQRTGFLRLAPDLAVEVLSPTDRIGDARAKIEMYLAAGVRLAWLVDPEAQTVTVFEPGAAPVVLNAGDEITGGAVLPAFRASVADFFA